MAIRVKMRWDGAAYGVDLPTYRVVNGSFRPVIDGVIGPDGVLPETSVNDPRLNGLTCEVEVPVNLLNPNSGRPDIALIRAIYRGQPRWDTDDRELDI